MPEKSCGGEGQPRREALAVGGALAEVGMVCLLEAGGQGSG